VQTVSHSITATAATVAAVGDDDGRMRQLLITADRQSGSGQFWSWTARRVVRSEKFIHDNIPILAMNTAIPITISKL